MSINPSPHSKLLYQYYWLKKLPWADVCGKSTKLSQFQFWNKSVKLFNLPKVQKQIFLNIQTCTSLVVIYNLKPLSIPDNTQSSQTGREQVELE